jgi:hypothetical protein
VPVPVVVGEVVAGGPGEGPAEAVSVTVAVVSLPPHAANEASPMIVAAAATARAGADRLTAAA